MIQLRTVTSSPSWRLCSVIYMSALAAALRSEVHFLGDAGVFWLLPCAATMVLASAIFMTRRLDFSVATFAVWLIFLLEPTGLLARVSPTLLAIYVMAVTIFAAIMNQSYILGTMRLMAARDDFRLMSETDALTGLENRRKFIGRLDPMIAARAPVLLLLLDIDYFKKINDRWGHSVGDQALVQIAGAIRSAAGALASARLGGEEFAIILSCSAPDGIPEVIHAFCDHLSSFDLPATLSGGAVWLSREKNSVAALVAADVQLYLAKDAGRHRIFFDGGMASHVTAEHALIGHS
ncbi:GGDEF domain-containing protein [Frateuria aurantia]